MKAAGAFRIGVDIGGTFTDLVLRKPNGAVEVHKVPTVSDDPSEGVIDALERAAACAAMEMSALVLNCTLFVHGSTIATNTVLEGKGARTGLVTTEGFRDALEIRRGQRDDPWTHRVPYPPVLVARALRRPVRGRIDRSGREREALRTEDVDAAFERFEQERVEAVAVCLFNGYLNDAHEQTVVHRLASLGFGGPLSASSAVAPIMGEFERTSTTVLNAYVAPRTLSYLRKLERRLVELGLRAPLLLVQSNGGTISLDELGERPVTLLLSGPASGVAALDFYRAPIGSDDLISMEIGGTSCDVILMTRGEVAFTDLLDIGGYKCVTPAVDVHTVGAGGGAIAHLDAAGLLRIGPRGAGAHPGPACYGRGGHEPTVTDAQVVLGRMRPGEYAHGAVKIDRDLAASAVESAIASPLGLAVERAAIGILELMDQTLLHAVQRVSSERGHDPARLTLVACGGAGPLHASSVGRQLGCRGVYVPRLSGAFCALGMLHANLRHDFFAMHFAELSASACDAVESAFRALERRARESLAREGFGDRSIEIARGLDLRYRGQQWDVSVVADAPFDPAATRARFEREHDRLFGHVQPEGTVEITKVRVGGVGRSEPLEHAMMAKAESRAKPLAWRRAWIDARTGWRETPVYAGADLHPGHGFAGPAIVEEDTTTLLVGADDRLDVDAFGNYRMQFAA